MGRIAVAGATGNVGGAVVASLASAGADVVGLTRREPLGAGRAPFRRADLDDPVGTRAALEGVDALFLLVAGADPGAVLGAVRDAGVTRVVLLSSQGAGTRPEAYGHARATEDAVRASGLAWTVLRPTGFASNAFAWAGTVRARRTVEVPFPDVALPVVDPGDVAEVAAAVLASGSHEGRTLDLTGPVAVSPRTQATVLARVLGEPLALVELDREAALARFRAVMPDAVARATVGILGAPRPAEQRVSGDVEEVLGRPAGSVEGWFRRHVHAFR